MGVYIEIVGALLALIGLCLLYWRDPYRRKAKEIMSHKKEQNVAFEFMRHRHPH